MNRSESASKNGIFLFVFRSFARFFPSLDGELLKGTVSFEEITLDVIENNLEGDMSSEHLEDLIDTVTPFMESGLNKALEKGYSFFPPMSFGGVRFENTEIHLAQRTAELRADFSYLESLSTAGTGSK